MSLEEKIKKNIREKNIEPKSKWNFIFKEWFLWFLGVCSIIIGGLIISAILFYVKNTHWGLYRITHDSIFVFILEFLPIIWLILFSAFFYLTYKFIRKTKRGYKYNFTLIILGAVLMTFIFGFISFSKGAGFIIENKLGKNIPFYKDIERKEKIAWNNTEEGLFVGVISVENDNLYLRSDNQFWVIDVKDLPEHLMIYFESDNYLNEMVRIVGTTTSEGVIYPCMIFPFDLQERNFFSEKRNKIKNEINSSELRINNCRDVRPYRKLLEQ